MNFMKLNTFSKALITGLLFAITGCGGGGGGGGGGTTATTVSGVASKGLVNGSTVKIFAVDANGNRSTTPLATTPAAVTTTTNGAYSCTINYSGMVVVEVSGGTYTDEATKQP